MSVLKKAHELETDLRVDLLDFHGHLYSTRPPISVAPSTPPPAPQANRTTSVFNANDEAQLDYVEDEQNIKFKRM